MKIINLLFIILLLFQSTPTFSMNEGEGLDEFTLILLGKAKVPYKVSTSLTTEYEQKESTVLKKSEVQKDAGRSDDDCCTHWGLKRWVYGIKEYVIDRCLCCTMCGFNHMDEGRAYKHNQYDGFTSDCFCVLPCPSCHNNPITGTLCFPLVATTHLLCCLPCACCSPNNRDEWYGTPSPEKQLLDAEKEKLESKRRLEKSIEEYKKLKEAWPSLAPVPYSGGNYRESMYCPYYQTSYQQGGMGGNVYIQGCMYQHCNHCGKVHQRM